MLYILLVLPGKPKGVMIENRAVNNFVKGITEKIEFTADKTILALTTISFDIFVLETIIPLSRGMMVIIASKEQQGSPIAQRELINRHNINMLQMTPSRMQMLISCDETLNCLKNVTEIMIGGEAFPELLLSKIKSVSSAKIYNMYGPTETTVWSAIKELTHEQKINIGKPIANTQIYILQDGSRLQAKGALGELCISGDGLARGYLNRPELTGKSL